MLEVVTIFAVPALLILALISGVIFRRANGSMLSDLCDHDYDSPPLTPAGKINVTYRDGGRLEPMRWPWPKDGGK